MKLSGLRADRTEAAPGDVVRFSFAAENAESVSWTAKRSDGLDGGSGSAGGGAFEWKPAQSGVYTVEVTAVGGDMATAGQKCEVVVRAGKLSATAKASVKYAKVDEKDLAYDLAISGGVEPYAVNIAIEYKGHKIFTTKEFATEISWNPAGYGEHTLRLRVTDATGATASAESVILAADNARDKAPELPKLRRDMTLAERLVAVAESQVGYRESKTNFIVRDDKSVQGWTFYGQWAGMPFEEWCAMFAEYCLEMAGIPAWMMPRNSNCNRWKNSLGKRYIDDEDDYIPEPGDLIFFHHDRVSKDPNFPNHVGIVTKYDPEKDLVYTVEGNTAAAVSVRIYNRDNYTIVGYASMGYCMKRWDKVYRQRMQEKVADDRAQEKIDGRADTRQKLRTETKVF